MSTLLFHPFTHGCGQHFGSRDDLHIAAHEMGVQHGLHGQRWMLFECHRCRSTFSIPLAPSATDAP